MNLIQRTALRIIWPQVKKIVIGLIKNETYKRKLIESIDGKVKIPNLSDASERKLFTQIVDTIQEALIEIVQKIEIEVFMK